MGVRVSETTAETTTEVLRTTANSLNRRPTTPRHEQQRDEDGDQADGEGDDGEADLCGALVGGLQRGDALLDVADDVLDHDDGVVDDEAGGDGERHEAEVVEAVAAAGP